MTKMMKAVGALVLFFFLFCPDMLMAQQCDMIIANGKIIDGTGNGWFYGDVAIKDGRIVGVGEAIRRMTSLPAQKFQLRDRGLIREGMAADIVVFDENEVLDQSTFAKPHAYSKGFVYILVNGAITLSNGRHTGVRAGQVLKGPGTSSIAY